MNHDSRFPIVENRPSTRLKEEERKERRRVGDSESWLNGRFGEFPPDVNM